MKVVVLLATTTLKRLTDDDGFTLACTTITSRSRSISRVFVCFVFLVENERSDEMTTTIFSQFFKKRKMFENKHKE